jgi:chemotaxis protein MotB
MQELLRAIGAVLGEVPNRLTLEGHTDATPFSAGDRGYSNWELSADRANAARKELVAGSMDETKIRRILGLSSSVPLIKENPAAAVNRRISIVVLNRRAERRINEQNDAGSTAVNLQDMLEPAPAPGISIPGVPVLPGSFRR